MHHTGLEESDSGAFSREFLVPDLSGGRNWEAAAPRLVLPPPPNPNPLLCRDEPYGA